MIDAVHSALAGIPTAATDRTARREPSVAPQREDSVELSPRARKLAGSGPTTDDPERRAQLERLKAADRDVRAHEQAHRTAGGDLVRGTTRYQYQIGPDGQRYAVGGEVQIDTSPESDPAATLAKAERILRAALAPAHPSPADRRVAAQAAAMAARARVELARGSDPAAPPGLDVTA